ncbi:unnamed protein product [Heligmosomoides polygyrus]|uniref:Uncharacterized protein n=1 Tax=Heligmosomoides polygyrus TaxID=6339 RepID=A0A183G4C5_HELPZ|nr:unnamed protein product [Heligmosomoides polygyrus]
MRPASGHPEGCTLETAAKAAAAQPPVDQHDAREVSPGEVIEDLDCRKFTTFKGSVKDPEPAKKDLATGVKEPSLSASPPKPEGAKRTASAPLSSTKQGTASSSSRKPQNSASANGTTNAAEVAKKDRAREHVKQQPSSGAEVAASSWFKLSDSGLKEDSPDSKVSSAAESFGKRFDTFEKALSELGLSGLRSDKSSVSWKKYLKKEKALLKKLDRKAFFESMEQYENERADIIECTSLADKRERFLELLEFDLNTYEIAKEADVFKKKTLVFVTRKLFADTLGEIDSSPITSGNVFRSLNNRTQRKLDVIVGQDLSRKSSDLARLLHIARCDAYENGNPAVLALIQSEDQSTRRKSGIVILFGPLVGPLDPKRYGNCIVVEPQGNRFITATEQTVENKDERTLLEEHGCCTTFLLKWMSRCGENYRTGTLQIK